MIFEPLERGFYGPINLLRSSPQPPSRCFVHFVNYSYTKVKVLWVNFDGHLEEYRTLPHGRSFTCNTYEDHVWVFRDCHSLDPMCVKNKEVYHAKPTYVYEGEIVQPRRAVICIHRPLKSLRVLAARAVRDQLKGPLDPLFIEMPFNLQVMLIQMLMKKLKCLLPPEELETETGEEEIKGFLSQQLTVFQQNIESICHGICRHAEELSMLSMGGGELHTMIRESLFTLSNILRYNSPDRGRTMHMKEIGPLIWKQMLHQTVLEDLFCMESLHTLILSRQEPLNCEIMRLCLKGRDDRMIPSHCSTLQRYHWEQLGKLLGLVRYDLKRDHMPYDIPEVKAVKVLSEDERWFRWINALRDEIREFSRDKYVSYQSHAKKLLCTLDIIEMLFQVLCIYFKFITGLDVPEMPGSVQDSDVYSPAFYEPPTRYSQ